MRRLIGIVLTLGMMLTFVGCGEKAPAPSVEQTPVTSTSVSVSVEPSAPENVEPVEEEKTGPVVVVDEDRLMLYAGAYEEVDIVDENGINVFNFWGMGGYPCGIFENFLMVREYDNDSSMTTMKICDLYADALFEVCSLDYISQADIYKDIMYVRSYDYDLQMDVERAFDIYTKEEVENYQYIYDEVADYVVLLPKLDTAGRRGCMRRCLEEYGYVMVTNGEDLFAYDGNTLRYIDNIEDYGCTVEYYDKDCIVYTLYEGDKSAICYFNLNDNALYAEKNAVNAFLGYYDGAIYAAVIDDYEYGQETVNILRYEFPQKKQLLASFKKQPGFDIMPGIEGFTIQNGYIYCIAALEDDVRWFVLPLDAEDTVEASPSDIILSRSRFAEDGKIRAISKSYICPICGKAEEKDYIEYFQFNEGLFRETDAVNKLLEENAYGGLIPDDAFEYGKCQEDLDIDWLETIDSNVSNVLFIGDKYVTIDTDGYWYGGGAHGYPTKNHLLIDKTKATLLSFSDICPLSDEELKEIVASKVMQDFEYNGDFYFAATAEEAYNTAYENIDKENILCSYIWDGVYVEFSPYIMGPYASGYIEVFVPYEELGINLN